MQETGPVKIVFVLPALTAGGAERVLITLMNGLDRDKFTPSLVNIGKEEQLLELVDEGIAYHCLSSTVKTGLPRLYKKLKELQPDMVVSTMAHSNFAVLLLKPFFPGTSFIVREAITPSFILRKHKRYAFLIKTAYRFLYSKADLVISPARAIIDEFKKLGMETGHHKVLPNPVDTRRIRGLSELPEREHQGMVEFLCAGRLHHQKGYDRLIAALLYMHQPSWHLTILGEGPERRRLEIQLTKEALTEKVSLPGHTDTPWPFMAAADCLLLPSRWEGLPNVVLESLAAGTPVIATTESGGIEEIADKAPKGAVTVARDMEEFVAAMNEVKAKPAMDYRPSLLPASYEKEAVQEKFAAMLCAVKTSP